jgi:gluconolactonase
VEPSGLKAQATERVFAIIQEDRIGVPDGMKDDVEGNVYCTGPGGIWLFNAAGTHLGTIATGAQTTNVAWGDDDWSTLYFTTWQTLGRIRMKIPGIPVPHRR